MSCTWPSLTGRTARRFCGRDGAAGETWTCTFNNTTNTGTIKVIKKVDGVQKAGWTVNAVEPGGSDDDHAGDVVTIGPGTGGLQL